MPLTPRSRLRLSDAVPQRPNGFGALSTLDRQRGISIPEALIVSAVLLLLFGSISLIFGASSRVWRKVDLRTSLIRELQVAVRHLERDLEVTHPFGLARAENALAYLSATDEDNEIEFDDSGRPLWQRFLIVYIDEEGQMRRRAVSLAAPTDQPPTFRENFGQTLEQYLHSSTGQDRYLTRSGRILTFELKNTGHYGSLFELTITGEQPVGSVDTEEFTLQTKLSIRN